VTRERKLREVLNVRLDQPLAREIQRIAVARGQTESEVARMLLTYGAEVERRLEAQALGRHHAAPRDSRPSALIIEARREYFTDEELDEMGV